LKYCIEGGFQKSIFQEVILGKAQPYPSMVDLVVGCYISSHDQQDNIGHDIEHYEDNFE
jgi:hypothetical protein